MSGDVRLVASRKGMLPRLLPKAVLSVCIGALLAWVAARGGVPLWPPRGAMSRLAPWAVPLYLVVLAVSHFFRASRWRFLLAPVERLSLRDVVALNWVGFFAIFALPLRLGELARPALGKLRHGIPLSAGFGTVAVERVLDGIVTSLLVVVGVFLLPHRESTDPIVRTLPFYALAALALFAGGLLAIALFLWKRRFAERFVRGTIGRFSSRWASLLAAKLGSMADGLRSVAEPRLLGGFMAESLLYWGTNVGSTWLLAVGCGVPITPWQAMALVGVLALGILLPTGPGLFGNFQLAVGVGLKLYVAEDVVGSEGALFVFLLYGVQAVFILLTGVIPLYAMHLRLSDLLRVRLEEPPPSGVQES